MTSAGASLNKPSPPQLQQLALNFLATFFKSRHPAKQRPSFSRHCSSPLRSPFYSLTLPLPKIYGLSLPIRPFQGPLYTVVGLLSPWVPPVGGSEVICAGSAYDSKLIAPFSPHFRHHNHMQTKQVAVAMYCHSRPRDVASRLHFNYTRPIMHQRIDIIRQCA